MLTKAQLRQYQEEAVDLMAKAGIVITDSEKDRIEIADMGLNQFTTTGLGILVYVNTERCRAKELTMWPRQTCPEHRHPPVAGKPGKEETFRCRWGRVFLYVPGAPCPSPQAKPPADKKDCYTVWHEIELNPGDQYTLPPDTWHWFQAGDEGAVVSEFSTASTDEHDMFADKEIQRTP